MTVILVHGRWTGQGRRAEQALPQNTSPPTSSLADCRWVCDPPGINMRQDDIDRFADQDGWIRRFSRLDGKGEAEDTE